MYYLIKLTLSDDADVDLVYKLVEEKKFYPNEEELLLVKGWIIYNLEDIMTGHISGLAVFRPNIRLINKQMKIYKIIHL